MHVGARVSDKFADTAASTSGKHSYGGLARVPEQRYVPLTYVFGIV